jgi:hypothetical protein
MTRYDEHAEFQLARRNIDKALAETTLREPDATEIKGNKRSFLKCLPGRHVMLRIVTSAYDPKYVITAYFDRKKSCV